MAMGWVGRAVGQVASAIGRFFGGSKPASQPIPAARLRGPEERQAEAKAADERTQKYRWWMSGRSSWIDALRFNPTSDFAQMRVKKGAKIYTFARMTLVVFEAWYKAGSWGSYFNRFLKGRYKRA